MPHFEKISANTMPAWHGLPWELMLMKGWQINGTVYTLLKYPASCVTTLDLCYRNLMNLILINSHKSIFLTPQ